jgi:menaquinone reductase, molybdopterin-binding-like subunit
MEITRRNFVQLLAGGTAGIHMTPLPWKLMDDIAIWTQNWPWVPVPEVGAFQHEKTVCSLCPGGCGIEVRKVDDRAVKIEGRTDYPVNPGGICPLGAGGLQLLYDETIRFTGPMKRVGPRGAGQFQPVSWKEALQTLAGRIQTLRKENRPEALAAVDGHRRDSTVGLLVERLLQAVGSPNTLRMPTIEDTYATANRLMQGTDGPMAYDLENADFILSFGCGLIEGWGAPGRVIDAWGRWHEDVSKKNEPKIVQAESRASNTASKADLWIAPRPGTEAALALGMAHVMIRENLVDGSFLSNYAHGFEDWTSEDGAPHRGFKSVVLEKYVPETAAEITGVPREKIVALAREFGKARSPLAVYGKGKGNLNGSVLECMAVQSLNALKGNINKPGGAMVYDGLPLATWAPVEFDAVANQGLARTRLDGAAGPDYPLSESRIGAFPQAILDSSGTPPVDTLLVLAANPVFTLPDGGACQKALEKIPFIVSFSPFRDETSVMADLVLPDHTALEKTEDVGWPTGLQYPFFGLSRPVVGPVYDTRHSGDVLMDLARAVGGPVGEAFPWKNFEAALKERVQGLAETEGLTSYDGSPVSKRFAKSGSLSPDYEAFDDLWDQLESGGFWYRPKHEFYTWSSCFQTPSGKFEFYSNRLAEAAQASGGAETTGPALRKMGIEVQGDEAFMPHYEPVLPGRADEDTLVLIPYELFNLSTGWLPSPSYLTKTLFDTQLRKQDSFAEINPGTAAKHGLREGDRVTIQSDAGEVTARVHLFEGAMPGNLYLPLGLGHAEGGIYLKGKGANPTDLIVGGTDPVSGHIQWWGTRVRVKKA